jgi:hypothetical protein
MLRATWLDAHCGIGASIAHDVSLSPHGALGW